MLPWDVLFSFPSFLLLTLPRNCVNFPRQKLGPTLLRNCCPSSERLDLLEESAWVSIALNIFQNSLFIHVLNVSEDFTVELHPETQKTAQITHQPWILAAGSSLPPYTADTWVDHSYWVFPRHFLHVMDPKGCRRLSHIKVVVSETHLFRISLSK